MLRGTLHLIREDIDWPDPTVKHNPEAIVWLDWDVFDHWRFVWDLVTVDG